MSYLIDRGLGGRDFANAMLAGRFIIRLIVAAIFGVLAVGLICYETYQDLALELSFRRKYGAAWVAEFEQYHGPVSRTNTHIIAGVLGMASLIAVVGGFCWVMFHKHKRHRAFSEKL